MRTAAFAAISLALCGCAAIGKPEVCEPFPIDGQVGATWVRSVRDHGSFGSGTSETKQTRKPPRTWRGREVFAAEQANGTALLQERSGALVAVVNGEKVMTTWDPPPVLDLPARVGHPWVTKTRVTFHARNETVALEERWTVEAIEDVVVAAGKFRSCRLKAVDNQGNENVHWFSPDIGLFVRQRLVRTERHARGPGSRETELVSQDVKKR
jgi:hypothetical protein